MVEQELLTGDVHLVRRLNRDVILKLIREHGPISRTALARRTQLTPATAFSIVEELMSQDLVRETGIGPSGGGRRPMLFEFNGQSYGVIGVVVRSSQVLGLVCDLEANTLLERAIDFKPEDDPDVVELIKAIVRELIQDSHVNKDRLMGIGIAVPGLVDVAEGIVVQSESRRWENLPLRDILAEEFELPIYVEADDKALAIGESFFGAGKEVPNAVYIKVGGGLGAGLIIDGALVRGSDNMAGEIGHILIDPEGPRCKCGNYGCLMTLVIFEAIKARAEKNLKLGALSSLTDRVGGDLDRLSVEIIAEEALAGDAFAGQIMRETGRYLGVGIATLVNLLNPDMVIIGGSFIKIGAPWLDVIQEVVRRRTFARPGERVKILPAKMSIEAPAVGAATIVMIQEGALPARGFIC